MEKSETEHKKAEKALRESEEHYRRIIEAVTDYIFTVHVKEGRPVETTHSPTSVDVTGYRPEEFVDDANLWIKMVHEKDRAAVMEQARCILSGQSKPLEHRIVRKDGTIRWVRNTPVPHYDAQGKLLSYDGLIRDITGRKKTEEDLQESEKRYRSLFESMLNGCAYCNILLDEDNQPIDFVHLEVNDAWESAIGIKKEDIVGKKITEVIPDIKESKTDLINIYGKVALTGEEIKFDIYFETLEKWFTISVYSPQKGYFVAIFEDITERKKTEEALKESEEKFRTFMETASDLMHIADKDGNFTFVNESMARTLGYSKEEMIGMHVTQVLSKEEVEKYFKSKWEELVKTGKIDLTTVWKTKEGKEIYGETKVVAIYDSDGKYAGYRVVSRDITENKRLEEQLRIRQRIDSLGTLAGGIAHDFNNILVGIMGYIDVLNLESEGFTEIHKGYLQNAAKSCDRATKLINKFQNLSRGVVSEKKSICVHEIANEVFDVLKETTNRLIKKKIEIKPGDYYVHSAPSEFHQVLMNLGTNAVHAIEERGVKQGDYIKVTAEEYCIKGSDKTGLPEGEYIHILFKDNGIGMSDEIRRKAFDPLFTTSEKGKERGQGLGLAIVYNIITRIHKGHIEIESEEGKGTTIHIYIPKAQPEKEVKAKEVIGIRGGTETILVVDDEEMILGLAENILKRYGYNIKTAVDGEQALKVYKENKDSIDVVILDLTMPEMSGARVLERILEIKPDAKVIISTGHGDEEARHGILSEAKGYVKKPYKVANLAETLRTVLDL